ncbi:14 kDa zinc-binding protein [Senna tora]|uniref:14 kDa zinc-binding protein n=1 Tax=Senna tora TaxID=362788 RepID=A0A834SE64_9FABA|nr:14 kDa zinc-binding protein [Senna tora]
MDLEDTPDCSSSSSSYVSGRIAVLASHFTSMASEKEAALASTSSDAPTIFDQIINKEIPSTVVYEDDKVLACRDIFPQAPTHILIFPKVKDGLTGLSKVEERHCEILGRLLYTAKLVAKQEGLDDGFRIVINDGPKECSESAGGYASTLDSRRVQQKESVNYDSGLEEMIGDKILLEPRVCVYLV